MHHADGLPRRDSVWWSVGANGLEARFWIVSVLPFLTGENRFPTTDPARAIPEMTCQSTYTFSSTPCWGLLLWRRLLSRRKGRSTRKWRTEATAIAIVNCAANTNGKLRDWRVPPIHCQTTSRA